MHSTEAAMADLTLLGRLSPGHSLLKTGKQSPERYAEKILYALLDLTTKEKIRLNRRQEMALQEDDPQAPEGQSQSNEGEAPTDQAPVQVAPESAKGGKTPAQPEKKSSPKKKSTPKSPGKTSSTRTRK